MTTTAKPQKGLRLTPRPTAASAARAARNATTRSMIQPVSQRQSPTRAATSPVSTKIKNNAHRCGLNSISKTDVKNSRNCESVSAASDIEGLKEDCELPNPYTESDATVILEKQSMDHLVYPLVDDIATMQDIPTFGLNIVDDNVLRMEEDHNELLDSRKVKPNNTPVGSRPQTPGSLSSRPQTPRIPSRPSTPAKSGQRPGTPVSRPTTPQRACPTARPKTPTTTTAARPISPVFESQNPLCDPIKRDDLKSVFATKLQQYRGMKRELDLKQQALLEVFEALRNIRDQLHFEGVATEEMKLQEFVVFNVGDWATEEVSRLCRDAAAAASTDGAAQLIDNITPVDERALAEVETKAMNVPAYFADLCIQAFSARQEIIDWIKDIIANNEMGSQEMTRISQYNAQGLALCEALRDLKSQAKEAVDTVTQFSKQAFRERAMLITVGESLVREVARLRHDLQARVAVVQEVQDNRSGTEATKDLRQELEEERAARAVLKDKLTTSESQLRQARMRVTKMDRQLKEAEASIASLTGTVKSLEDQSRQKEVHLEARARKLKESLKTGEMASSQLSQQRDTLHAEVATLRETLQTTKAHHDAAVHELQSQIKNLVAALEEEKKISAQEKQQRETLEKSLGEKNFTIEELKAKIIELENIKPNPELPTEREMDLWAELQATKDILRSTEDEVVSCKRDKIKFLETLTKISETENKVGMQQKLAAELLSKEEIISKMHGQIRELTKNIKLNEQKVIQYEQYVRDLQAHNRVIANCQESPNGISYQDLQQEIMNLRMGLLEAVHRNEELSEMLVQKEQHIDQQDKTSRAQARVIKVREELINLLKNKETEQSRELTTLQQDLEHRMKIVDDVNKQIAAKADEIQELFATLENKQQQIHRLEKIILALEEQQRRAQAQRTRQEEKIAALEHELAAGGNRRERKFLFF